MLNLSPPGFSENQLLRKAVYSASLVLFFGITPCHTALASVDAEGGLGLDIPLALCGHQLCLLHVLSFKESCC